MHDIHILGVLLRQSIYDGTPVPWRLSPPRRRPVVDASIEADERTPFWRRRIRFGKGAADVGSGRLVAAGWAEDDATGAAAAPDDSGWDEVEASKPRFWRKELRFRSKRDERTEEQLPEAEEVESAAEEWWPRVVEPSVPAAEASIEPEPEETEEPVAVEGEEPAVRTPFWKRDVRFRRKLAEAVAETAAEEMDEDDAGVIADDEPDPQRPSFFKRALRFRREPADTEAELTEEPEPDTEPAIELAQEPVAVEGEQAAVQEPFWQRGSRFRKELAETVADSVADAGVELEPVAPEPVAESMSFWKKQIGIRRTRDMGEHEELPEAVEPLCESEPVQPVAESLSARSEETEATDPGAAFEPDQVAVEDDPPGEDAPYWQRQVRFRHKLAEAVAEAVGEPDDEAEAVEEDDPAAEKRTFWKLGLRRRRELADPVAEPTDESAAELEVLADDDPASEKPSFWQRGLRRRGALADAVAEAIEESQPEPEVVADGEFEAERRPFWKRQLSFGREPAEADELGEETELDDDEPALEAPSAQRSFWHKRPLRRDRRTEPDAVDEVAAETSVQDEPTVAATDAEAEPKVPFWKKEIRLGRSRTAKSDAAVELETVEPEPVALAPDVVAVEPEPEAAEPTPLAVEAAAEPPAPEVLRADEDEKLAPAAAVDDPLIPVAPEPMVVAPEPLSPDPESARPAVEPWWLDDAEGERAPELPPSADEAPTGVLPAMTSSQAAGEVTASGADEPSVVEHDEVQPVEEPIPLVVVEPEPFAVAAELEGEAELLAEADTEVVEKPQAKRRRRQGLRGRKSAPAESQLDGESESESAGWEEFPVEESGPVSAEREAKGRRRRLGGHRKKRIVGLKIGASQLAAATVVNNGSIELEQVVREPLERGIVVGGELRDPEALAEALARFFKKHKLPKKGVRLGLATNRIGVRSFEITGIDDPKQLENAVRFRAQDALPIPLNEAALDYHVLEERIDAEGNLARRVLLVVAYRDLVDRYVEACRKAGVKLVGVDLEAFAVLRALAEPRVEDEPASAALVVVSVGHDRSTLAVSDGRVCEFTRVLDWGGGAIDVAVARALDATPSEVASFKHTLSLDADATPPAGLSAEKAEKARAAALDQLQAFARELVSSLHFYQTQSGSLEIGEIVLTGGGAHLAGFVSELERLTGVGVRIGDPLVRVKVGRRVDTPQPLGSLAVAIGLGIED